MENELTQEEGQELVNKVADAAMRGILTRIEYIEILKICRDACDRRIAELDEGRRVCKKQ